MTDSFKALAALFVGTFGAAVFARPHNGELPDRIQGVRIASRIPCDGSTNPQEELGLATSFSAGGGQRAFHLDVFESQFCKRLDLYFFCLSKGHDRWKHAWAAESQGPPAPARYWMNTCADWESKDAAEYLLSGWYQEGSGPKLPWKQAALKKISETPEIYEFADSSGGTARIEIHRK